MAQTTLAASSDDEPSRRPPGRRRARNRNGAGSITRRKDGRYQGMAYLLTTAGTYKRKYVYGKTWDEVHDKLVGLQADSRKGVPIPERSTKLAEYLTYWLAAVVKVERRPKTYQGYEGVVRLHLVPRARQEAHGQADRTGRTCVAQPGARCLPVLQARLGHFARDTPLLCAG